MNDATPTRLATPSSVNHDFHRLGGLPSPGELAEYERAVPGSGERILALAEKSSEQGAAIAASESFRRDTAHRREHLTRRLTQGFVAVISITAVVTGGGILFLSGNWEASLIAVGVPACALAAMAIVTRPTRERLG